MSQCWVCVDVLGLMFRDLFLDKDAFVAGEPSLSRLSGTSRHCLPFGSFCFRF